MSARAEVQQRGSDRALGLIGALDLVLDWIERSKQRAKLARLESDALHDLGLSRADLDAECRKHFWQR
ncbi:MAG TPA: DUF1127 domain-containing protein [Dongiaceae bacterium]|nr:DUF1127 domain-containing protein [Dongiaceae bacterium]